MTESAGSFRLARTTVLASTLLGLIAASPAIALVADFTWTPVSPLPGESIQFVDTSIGEPSVWQWDFDNDGVIDSTAQNPTHVFAVAGTYPVTLTILEPPLEMDEITHEVVVVVEGGPAGDLGFTDSSYSIAEDGGTAQITIERSGGASGVVSVRCSTSDGSARAGDDYTATQAVLTWADQDTEDKICPVPIIDDVADENAETVLLTLSDFAGGAGAGPRTTATLVILDDDEAGNLSFTMGSYSVNEEDGLAVVAVRRTSGSDGAVSAVCSTSDGSASAGDDYVATMDVLEWDDGETANRHCTIPIVDDAEVEGEETILLTLSDFTGGADPGTPVNAILTIDDNDQGDAGSLSFTLSSYQVGEGLPVATIPVRRTGGSGGEVSVRCETSDGTATAPEDYEATMDVLIWLDGDSGDKFCTIPIVDDAEAEGHETVNLSLADFTGGATVGEIVTATLTLLDNEAVLSFAMSDVEVDEDVGMAQVPVLRSGGSAGEVSVVCATADGTATAPEDYTATLDLLVWADGDMAAKHCTIPIDDDGAVEDNETIQLSLTDFEGAGPGDPATATLTIVDNEHAGSLSFVHSSYEANEDAGVAQITVGRSGGSDGAVSVLCETADGTATAPEDYTSTSEVLEWAAGDSEEKFCTVPIADDASPEGDETVLLSLSGVIGGATIGEPSTAILTLFDPEDIFADGFESGETSAWSTTVDPPDGPSGSVALRFPGQARLDCGPVQLAPASESGAVRLRLPSSEVVDLVLAMGTAVVLEGNTTVAAGEVIEIVGLEWGAYELTLGARDRPAIHLSVELSPAVPCVAFEIDGGLKAR